MRTVTSLADRVLSALVPQRQAAACSWVGDGCEYIYSPGSGADCLYVYVCYQRNTCTGQRRVADWRCAY